MGGCVRQQAPHMIQIAEFVCECIFHDMSGSSPDVAYSLTSVAMQVHQRDAFLQCIVHAGV